MSFTIHTVRFLTKEQLVLLNQEALEKQSPAAQDNAIVEGLDEGRYIVQAAKVNTETNQVRAKVLVNIGMIPNLWVELSLDDWRMLPVAEIPGDDETWNSLPLEIQEQLKGDDEE